MMDGVDLSLPLRCQKSDLLRLTHWEEGDGGGGVIGLDLRDDATLLRVSSLLLGPCGASRWSHFKGTTGGDMTSDAAQCHRVVSLQLPSLLSPSPSLSRLSFTCCLSALRWLSWPWAERTRGIVVQTEGKVRVIETKGRPPKNESGATHLRFCLLMMVSSGQSVSFL